MSGCRLLEEKEPTARGEGESEAGVSRCRLLGERESVRRE